MRIKTPRELGAFALLHLIEQAKDTADLEALKVVTDQFNERFDPTGQLGMCKLITAKAKDLEITIQNRQIQNKLYDTHNWFRALSRRDRSYVPGVAHGATGNAQKA